MSKRKALARFGRRLPLVGWLLLVWVLLWGRFDAGTLSFGFLVAVLVSSVFPVPPVSSRIIVRPFRLLGLAAYLAWDLTISTMRTAWQAVRYGPNVRAGIVAVRMVTDSDHVIAMVANAVSLAPGKFVLQIDRAQRICYVYVLGMAGDGIESVRREVLLLERRVVRAVGSAEDVAVVEAGVGEQP